MQNKTNAISLILFFLVLIIGSFLVPSIGPAWDEPDNMFSGGVYVNFFRHGFDPTYFRILTDKASAYGDRIVPQYRSMAELPPVHNYVGLLIVQAAESLHIPPTADVIIVAWHLATVLFFAVAVAMTYRFGLLLGLSFWPSLFSALAVFMYPQLFGHGLSNSKDTAQTAMVITSLYYLVRGVNKGNKGDRRVDKKDLFIGGVVWGLGMATKFNAIYVPIIWGLWAIIQRNSRISRLFFHLLFILIVGLATTFVAWPYLWFDPIGHALEIIRHFTIVGQGYRFIWDGTWYIAGAGKNLWWYPLLSFLYTTPIPLLAFISFGGITLIGNFKKNPAWVLLPIWILVPLLRTVSPWSAFYDLTRHFMEILPATLLVAAIGLEWFFQKKQHLRATGMMLGVIILGQMLYINALFFPYSTGYYNVLARSPNTNFDRDIEALSVKEAMVYVHQKYGNVRIYFTLGGHLSRYYLKPGDWYVNADQGKADIVIVINKASHFRSSDYVAQSLGNYTMVHEIRRGNAIFAWIFKKN